MSEHKQNNNKQILRIIKYYYQLLLLLLVAYAIKTHIIGQPGSSIIISKVKLRQTTVQLGKRAGFDDVGLRLYLTT